jgi:hypothetical protein
LALVGQKIDEPLLGLRLFVRDPIHDVLHAVLLEQLHGVVMEPPQQGRVLVWVWALVGPQFEQTRLAGVLGLLALGRSQPFEYPLMPRLIR